MTKQITIKRGLDIKLKGKALENISEISSEKYALKPTDFNGVFPKLSVKVGDKVKRGTPVFFDKYRDYIKFPSPVSGTVTEVVRGAKRKMLEIRIEADGNDEVVSFEKQNPSDLTAEKIKARLLESGLWSFIRQRPYTVIANPEEKPKAIFVSAFDTAPLAANLDYTLQGQGEAFQTGLDAIAKLTEGKLHLNVGAETKSDFMLNAKGVELNTFKGPHPVGNIGVQIHKLDPINKGDVVWTVQAQDVVTIGNLFLTGEYKPEVTIALAGSEVAAPQYYKVKRGMAIADIVNDRFGENDNVRIISGNVLTGTKVEKNGYFSYYHNSITVIPEGNQHSFFGWLIPSPKKHSFYRTAFSWLCPKKEYALNTNLNGGERAFVITGALEKVFPMDILPIQLIKATMIGDIDMMENLGIYEVDEEDFALCEYISTSKIEMQQIIREGLDMLRKEMS